MEKEEALKPEKIEPVKDDTKPKKQKKRGKAGIIVFVVGIVTLLAGVGFLLFNLFKAPDTRDAEYLVEIGVWQREDEPGVIWNFTEIGKGEITTNSHADEYDFIWAMEGNQIKIETSWLYTLNDEFAYELDQDAKILTLTNGENTYTFIPAETPNTTEEEPVE